MKTQGTVFWIALAAWCSASAVMCGEKKVPYDAAMATAVIKGVVVFAGKAPEMKEIQVADENCVQCRKQAGLGVLKKEDLVVNEKNKVANVFVFVWKGAEKFDFENYLMPNNAVLKIVGCQFVPHSLGLMVEQKIDEDEEAWPQHNLHYVLRNNESRWPVIRKPGQKYHPKFETPELGVIVKCYEHGWMWANICVFDHPFFAVTKEDGSFEIKVPPGEYTISTWHEMMPGRKVIAPEPQKVTAVNDKEIEMTLTLKMKSTDSGPAK